MYAAFTTVFAICALAPQVLAGVYVTNPVAGTSGQGGQTMTIQWQDDKLPPSLADIGPCEFGLFAGNMQQQTELQPINPSVDVGKQTTLDFKVDATIGPNSPDYFIRITSLALKDLNNTQFPYQAFSAKFPLSLMTGQFAPSVQAQINGVTSASAAGPTSAPAALSTPAASTPATVSSKITTSTGSAAKSTAASSSGSAAKATPSSAAIMTRSNVSVLGAGVAAVFLGLSL